MSLMHIKVLRMVLSLILTPLQYAPFLSYLFVTKLTLGFSKQLSIVEISENFFLQCFLSNLTAG